MRPKILIEICRLGAWSLYFSHSLCQSLQPEYITPVSVPLACLWCSCHCTLCTLCSISVLISEAGVPLYYMVLWCLQPQSGCEKVSCFRLLFCYSSSTESSGLFDSVALPKGTGARIVKKCENSAIKETGHFESGGFSNHSFRRKTLSCSISLYYPSVQFKQDSQSLVGKGIPMAWCFRPVGMVFMSLCRVNFNFMFCSLIRIQNCISQQGHCCFLQKLQICFDMFLIH